MRDSCLGLSDLDFDSSDLSFETKNKDIVARLIFHDADSSVACVAKKNKNKTFAHKNTRCFMETFITNCAFKDRVFQRVFSLYTPCTTRDISFYKLAMTLC